ncbi:DUF5926 family protein [Aeromicrobium terrae]|jgi:hypothetical protein|uniref:Topoisomerase II n=1 Tax=Aeromicrobium terrae TaxID=2498846 RepID=A0A5C8NCX9_9ACTN|nr:DUF5926 family protein [Aeromicrobium terrae]TXL57467.1 topoisomerase II [Aeromicrobium terrae]
MGKKSRRKKTAKERMPFVARTFEGLPGEADWIALREFVPAGTADVTLKDGSSVRVCSLLPGAGAGLVRTDGQVWLGLQVQHNFGDISRDLAHVLELAAETEPGTPITMDDPGVGPRLQDLVDPASSFDVTVHEGFDFWVEGTVPHSQSSREVPPSSGSDAIAQANEGIAPTTRLTSVEGAYWTRVGDHRWLRWVLPHDESKMLDALARLQQRGDDRLGEGTRLLGSFRAHGLLVPVWEMDPAVTDGAEALEEPAVAFGKRLEEALADTSDLTSEQRAVRNSLAHRQLTVR